jgi:hypothetical protein
LFQLQPANDKVDEITANTNPPGVPKPPVPSTTWTKIHDLLIKLNAEKIERVDSGISVEVDVKDGLTNGAYYFFFIVRPCRIAWFPVCIKRDPTTTLPNQRDWPHPESQSPSLPDADPPAGRPRRAGERQGRQKR